MVRAGADWAPALLLLRLVWFGAEEVGEDAALFLCELALVAGGVEHGGALIDGHGAQIPEGALDHGLAVGSERGEQAAGLVELHALLGGHALDDFGAGKPPLALLVGKVVDLLQLLYYALLIGWGELSEAGLVAQQLLLALYGQSAVLGEPRLQMTGRRQRRSRRGRPLYAGRHRLGNGPRLGRRRQSRPDQRRCRPFHRRGRRD